MTRKHLVRLVANDIAQAVFDARLTHEAIAHFFDKDRSLITKQLTGVSPISAEDLEGWMDLTGSIRPVQRMMLRLGYAVIPLAREAKPARLRRGIFELMRETGATCASADEALEDDVVDSEESEMMLDRLQGLIDQLQDLKAGLPQAAPAKRRTRR